MFEVLLAILFAGSLPGFLAVLFGLTTLPLRSLLAEITFAVLNSTLP